jgi:hypothetical protein
LPELSPEPDAVAASGWALGEGEEDEKIIIDETVLRAEFT